MKKLIKFFGIIILIFCLNSNIFAQKQISGKVLDEDGKGISNVVVKIKDMEISTISDADGNYKIWIPEDLKNIQFTVFQEFEVVNIDYVSDNEINITYKSIYDLSLQELMNTKVVTATGTSENINTAPATIYSITSEQIIQKGYTNLLELLKDQPAFDFDIQNGGWVSQVTYLRGTRSNSILIMIDGVIQNNINEGEMDKYHTIGLENISRVEIITGPATALYGANALVGVINLITKTPAEIDGFKVSGGYCSSIGDELFAFNKFNINTIFGKELKNGFGLMASLNMILSDDEGMDYYDPDNFFKKGHIKYGFPVLDDGFDNHQNDYISSIRLIKDKNFTFGIDYADIDEGLGTMVNGSWKFLNNDSIENKYHTRRLNAFAELKFNLTDKIEIVPKLYVKAVQTVNDTRFGQFYPNPNPDLEIYRYSTQQTYRDGLDLKIKYQILSNLNFMGGFVYEDSQTSNEAIKFGPFDNSNNTYNEQQPIIYDTYQFVEDGLGNVIDTILVKDTAFYQNNIQIRYTKQYSFYTQIVYDLNKNFKFIVGGRYYKESDFNETELKGAYTPRAGLVFNTSNLFGKKDQLILKLLYGQALKALANDEKGTMVKLEKELVPAKSTTYEFSAIYLPNTTTRFEITSWYTEISNYFVFGTRAPKLNILTQKTYGVQTVGQVNIGDFVFEANYTYTDGKNVGQWYKDPLYGLPDSTSFEKLIRVATHKANVSVSYVNEKFITVNLKMRFVGESNAAPNHLKYGDNNGNYVPAAYAGEYEFPEDQYYWYGTGKMPGFTLFDLNVGNNDLGNVAPVLKGISVYFQVSNLLNTDYLESSYSDSNTYPPYNPQPGRRFVVTLGYLLPF